MTCEEKGSRPAYNIIWEVKIYAEVKEFFFYFQGVKQVPHLSSQTLPGLH